MKLAPPTSYRQLLSLTNLIADPGLPAILKQITGSSVPAETALLQSLFIASVLRTGWHLGELWDWKF